MGLNDFYDQEVLVGSRDWPAASRYSEPLKALVRDCLKYWKEYRPTSQEILDRIEGHLAANPQLVLDAMDIAGTGLVLPDNDGFRVGEMLVAVSSTQ
jgi:hypothetical protein